MYDKDSLDMSLDEIEELIKEDDSENTVLLDDNITNILLIGSDGRTSNDRGRSDAMMIATIDERHKKIKLTSLARDTYVKIPGRGYEKLNHAYSYGGATLLMKTVENNFGIGISNYVNINFASFIDIIDSLGGITLDIKSSELSELNKFIPECYEASNNKKNSKMKLVKKAGVQKLNGYQALSYSRIRKNDSAFERDGRQRKVLQSLLNEASSMSFGEVTKVANAVFPYVKTNVKPMDMLKYIGKVLKIGNTDIEQLEFPIAKYSKGGIIKNKGWVLQFDSKKCLPILHKFIFEEEINYSYVDNKYDSHTNIELDDEEDSSNSSSSPDKNNSNTTTPDKENDSEDGDNNIDNENNSNKPGTNGGNKPGTDKPSPGKPEIEKPEEEKPEIEKPTTPENGENTEDSENNGNNESNTPPEGSEDSSNKPPQDNGSSNE